MHACRSTLEDPTCLGRLGLLPSRSTLVGRLSGGERKRASIAMELLTEPRLLFLDEPTSSLDPKYDQEVMQDLHQLAGDGHTVLLITHRTSNLAGNCSRVAVLARGGRLAYLGPPQQALAYFRRTAEALMAKWPEYKSAIRQAHVGASRFDDIYSIIEPPYWPDAELEKLAQYWQAAFARDPLYQREVSGRQQYQPASGGHAAFTRRTSTAVRCDRTRQFDVLCRRYLAVLWHDKRNLLLLLLQAPVLALLLALLFHPSYFQQPLCHSVAGASASGNCSAVAIAQANSNAGKGVMLAFFLAAIAVWLGTLNAIREIAKEDSIFRRERLVNLQVLPYVASKLAVLAGAGALQVAVLLIVVAILVRPFAGLGEALGSFCVLIVAAASGTAGALAVSASVSNQDRAMVMAPLLAIPQIMFAGVFIPISNAYVVPVLAVARWAYEGVGRVTDPSRLAGDLGWFQSQHPELSGNPAGQMLMLLILLGAYSALAYYLQSRKVA